MDKEILYAVLPCYNEENNIKKLVLEWNRLNSKLNKENVILKIIIVNDGSSDNTFAVATDLEREYNNVMVINHEINRGLGEALNTGFKYAAGEKDKGFVCVMDGDMTQSPEYIFSMLKKVREQKLDCVIASRYQKGAKVEGLSLYRKLLSHGARIVYSLIAKIPNVKDYTCGYRLYRIEALKTLIKKYNGKVASESGFACMMEILIKLNREGFKIGEVPFILKYQLKDGQSKMKVWHTIITSLCVLSRSGNCEKKL